MRAEPDWRSHEHVFAADHPTAAAHFPGQPLIPGAVLIDEVLRALAADGFAAHAIRVAKFLKPVRPGDRLFIRWKRAGALEIKFEAEVKGELAMTGIALIAAEGQRS